MDIFTVDRLVGLAWPIVIIITAIITIITIMRMKKMYKVYLNEKLARQTGNTLVQYQNTALIQSCGNIPGVVLIEAPANEKNEESFVMIYISTAIGILFNGLFFVFVPVVDVSLPALSRFLQGLLFGTFTGFTFLFLSVSLCFPYSFGARMKIWLTVAGFTIGSYLFGLILASAFPNIPTYAEPNLFLMLGFGFSGLVVIPFLFEGK